MRQHVCQVLCSRYLLLSHTSRSNQVLKSQDSRIYVLHASNTSSMEECVCRTAVCLDFNFIVSQWMGPDHSRPTPKSRAVAKGVFTVSSPAERTASGRSTPQSPQSTACPLFGKPVDLQKPQQSTPWRKCRGCSQTTEGSTKAAQARSKVQPVADRVE